MKKTIITIAGVIFFLLGAHAAYGSENSARDLFFNPVPNGAKALVGNSSSNTVVSPDTPVGVDLSPENIGGLGGIGGYYEKLENQGIAVWVELLRKGATAVQRVEPSRVFKSGDKIRIHITSNADGYLHALHRGTSGVEKIIPVSLGGRVQTGSTSVIPSNGGWLKFDHNVGNERVDLLFGSHGRAADSGIVPTSSTTPDVLRANIREVVDNYVASKNLVTFEQKGTKDLLVVNQSQPTSSSPQPALQISRNGSSSVIDPDVYSAPGQYAVNTADEPVVMVLNLKHQ